MDRADTDRHGDRADADSHGDRDPYADTDVTAVFERVSHPTRLDVLDALADAHAADPTDPWLAYTDLKTAVDVRDNGNFNYHLDALDDFVVKADAGYRLSRTGMELLTTAASGVLDTDWTWGPRDAPGTCPFCDDALEFHYTDGKLQLTCGIDEHAMALSAPPSLLQTTPDDELADNIAFLGYQWSQSIRQGVCTDCHAHVTGHVDHGGLQPDHHHYRADCKRCGYQHGVPLGLHLLTHPTVTHFHHNHDIDPRTTPWWTLHWTTPGTETTLQTDPIELEVAIELDDETLTLTIDHDGTITDTQRTRSE
ncbi:DUF7351 domain-containing protein [Halorubellus litoreus]|uniref:Helix-turn-helix domain-containing protein n=1 Tax=Halorubellus litoreus TaxID=755308 RepID=A0ABD5VM33_9EURY